MAGRQSDYLAALLADEGDAEVVVGPDSFPAVPDRASGRSRATTLIDREAALARVHRVVGGHRHAPRSPGSVV